MDKETTRIIKSFLPGLLLVAAFWLVKLIEIKSGYLLTEYGVFPRTLKGLRGILFSPFIHDDYKHLISNSLPMLVLMAVLMYFYKSLAARVFTGVFLLGGAWLWLGGREAYHIGASGLVYGLTTFLFFSGVWRRDTRLMALSMLVVFLYGGMVWGIFPLFKDVSWEAHLFGALAGITLSWFFRKEGPQRKVYEWENENDDEETDENAYWKLPEQTKAQEPPANNLNIHYIYQPSNQKEAGEQHPHTPPTPDEKN